MLVRYYLQKTALNSKWFICLGISSTHFQFWVLTPCLFNESVVAYSQMQLPLHSLHQIPKADPVQPLPIILLRLLQRVNNFTRSLQKQRCNHLAPLCILQWGHTCTQAGQVPPTVVQTDHRVQCLSRHKSIFMVCGIAGCTVNNSKNVILAFLTLPYLLRV